MMVGLCLKLLGEAKFKKILLISINFITNNIKKYSITIYKIRI